LHRERCSTWQTDLADPMAELRRFGITASVAWHGDQDHDTLVLVEPDPENLRRLERWLAISGPGVDGIVQPRTGKARRPRPAVLVRAA
jgi:hypothetical protein